MLYLYGTNMPSNKKVRYALNSIFGLGQSTANKICNQLGLSDNYKVSQLTDSQISHISQIIEENYIIQGDLRKEHYLDISRLINISCYRGLRHSFGLPVRGQRTHTNAKTQKNLSPKRIKKVK